MVIPFSNTKFRVPKGFQSLLVGLSTEVLRSQPKNVTQFAADYFDKLLQRREQGEPSASAQQSSLEDRYSNNQSFQDEYPVNDPEVNNAATKIQAKFRGHKARQNVEKMKDEHKQTSDTDRQDLADDRQQPPVSHVHGHPKSLDVDHKPPPMPSPHAQHPEEKKVQDVVPQPQAEVFGEEELTEEEKLEQEQAARSIQARFRGLKVRKNINRDTSSPAGSAEPSSRPDSKHPESEHDKQRTPTPSSSPLAAGHSQPANRTVPTSSPTKGSGHADRFSPERPSTDLSDEFERHTQIPRDLDFELEQRAHTLNDDDDDDEGNMSDSNLDKAATRIQASYRGYKTRKELGTGGQSSLDHSQDLGSSSAHAHEHDDGDHNKNILSPSAADNKVPDNEEDDNAAAVKIQAAFRGYRTRKDMDK